MPFDPDAAVGAVSGPLGLLNIMGLHNAQSAVLSAVIFNALVIVALIPLALRDDAQRIHDAAERCGRIVRTFLNMARQRPAQRGGAQGAEFPGAEEEQAGGVDRRWRVGAAAGQSRLMRHWEHAFGVHDVVIGQVLLTHDDLGDRRRFLSARHTLRALLDLGAVPIINENDTVATEEIKFGDNDQLASMVTPLCDADLLLLLSDVDGLLDEQKRRVPFVRSVAREARHLAGDSTSGVGTVLHLAMEMIKDRSRIFAVHELEQGVINLAARPATSASSATSPHGPSTAATTTSPTFLRRSSRT